MEMPGSKPVRIYTLQHPDALDVARSRGWLSGEHSFAFDAEEAAADVGFFRAYNWMRERMAERLPGFSGDLPIWAWLKRPTGRIRRNDSAGPLVRITAVVPRERMLLSDFDLFHCILNGHSCSWSHAEHKAFGCDPHADVASTWERVFDLSPHSREQVEWLGRMETVQACVDRIHMDEIVSVRMFSAR